MSQAPEAASQLSPPDVKPGKEEPVVPGNEPINVKVRVCFIYQVDGKHRAESTGGVLFFFFSPIQVVAANGEEVFFKIKRTTKLSKLQGAYANKVGKDVGSIRCVPSASRHISTYNLSCLPLFRLENSLPRHCMLTGPYFRLLQVFV